MSLRRETRPSPERRGPFCLITQHPEWGNTTCIKFNFETSFSVPLQQNALLFLQVLSLPAVTHLYLKRVSDPVRTKLAAGQKILQLKPGGKSSAHLTKSPTVSDDHRLFSSTVKHSLVISTSTETRCLRSIFLRRKIQTP